MSILDLIRARRDEVVSNIKAAKNDIDFLNNELIALNVAYRVVARLDAAKKCPNCGSRAFYAYKSRPIFKCRTCGKQFSETSSTTLRHHKLPVEKYEKAADMIRGGASATEITRKLGIGYKTALKFKHKAAAETSTQPPQTGSHR